MADDTTANRIMIDTTYLSHDDVAALLSGTPIRVLRSYPSPDGPVVDVQFVVEEADDEGDEDNEPDHDLSLEYPDEDLAEGPWYDD